MGTMVRRGTVMLTMRPSLMNWKETFTVFFSSPSCVQAHVLDEFPGSPGRLGLCFHTGDQGTADDVAERQRLQGGSRRFCC